MLQFIALLILMGSSSLYGGYLIYTSCFSRPTRISMGAVSKNRVYGFCKRYDFIETILAGKIQHFIHLTDEKRTEYSKMLSVLAISQSAEEYLSFIILKAMLASILSLLGLTILSQILLFPIMLVAPVVGIAVYIIDVKALKKKYLQRKIQIELELPKLCSVINSRLQSTSNIYAILSTFLPIANEAMAAELTVTLADIKTGNVETALRRLEGRISSPKVSDVVRGLIAVQHGDDMRLFFQAKQYQFNNDYISIKKKSVMERPMKLGLPEILAFVFCLLIILYPMLTGTGKMMNQL